MNISISGPLLGYFAWRAEESTEKWLHVFSFSNECNKSSQTGGSRLFLLWAKLCMGLVCNRSIMVSALICSGGNVRQSTWRHRERHSCLHLFTYLFKIGHCPTSSRFAFCGCSPVGLPLSWGRSPQELSWWESTGHLITCDLDLDLDWDLNLHLPFADWFSFSPDMTRLSSLTSFFFSFCSPPINFYVSHLLLALILVLVRRPVCTHEITFLEPNQSAQQQTGQILFKDSLPVQRQQKKMECFWTWMCQDLRLCVSVSGGTRSNQQEGETGWTAFRDTWHETYTSGPPDVSLTAH